MLVSFRARKSSPPGNYTYALIGLTLFLMSASTKELAILGVGATVVCYLIGFVVGRRFIEKTSPRLKVAPLISAVLVLLLVPGIWLPPERVVIDKQDRTVYILKRDDDSLIMFDPSRAVVLRVPEREVTDRQYCRFPSTVPWRKKPDERPICPGVTGPRGVMNW